MAPSSSDLLSPELAEGAMDFQPSSQHQHQQQQQHQQPQHQQPPVSQHPQSQPQPIPQPFHTDPYQSLQQPQQQYSQQQPQSQSQPRHQPFSQQQQRSGDSCPPQHAGASNVSAQQRQQPPNGDQQQRQHQEQHPHPHHAQHDSFASMIDPPPPASTTGSSSFEPNDPHPQPPADPQFDIFEWYPKYQSCQRYFTVHAQQSGHVQAVAAFVNIALPFQRAATSNLQSILSSPPNNNNNGNGNGNGNGNNNNHPAPLPRLSPSVASSPATTSPPLQPLSACISLIPYLRRLVVTGLDFPGVLHGFFGDDWVAGVGPLHEQERRNYLFAAKSGGWASVKKDYDMSPLETVPFLRPLQGPVIAEIEAAEKSWSEWLAMEDWMVGPRAPEGMADTGGGGHGSGGHERETDRR